MVKQAHAFLFGHYMPLHLGNVAGYISQLHGYHAAEKIISVFEEVVAHYKFSGKVFRVVTDNGFHV